MRLTGVHMRKEPKRFYPNGPLAASVLGFVGLDGNGLAGIEQVYNERISGEPGKFFIERRFTRTGLREHRSRRAVPAIR